MEMCCIELGTCTIVCVCIYVCVYIYIYVCVYVYICVCVYIYMCVCVCILSGACCLLLRSDTRNVCVGMDDGNVLHRARYVHVRVCLWV